MVFETRQIGILLVFASLLMVPAYVSAQNANEGQTTPSDNSFAGLIPEDDAVGPVGIVSELYKTHSTITDIMIETTQTKINEGYVVEDIYLEGVFVDEDAMELVVILDPAQSHDPADVEDLQEGLNINVPVRIMYGFLVPEASPSEATSCPASPSSNVCYYWGRYDKRSQYL